MRFIISDPKIDELERWIFIQMISFFVKMLKLLFN